MAGSLAPYGGHVARLTRATNRPAGGYGHLHPPGIGKTEARPCAKTSSGEADARDRTDETPQPGLGPAVDVRMRSGSVPTVFGADPLRTLLPAHAEFIEFRTAVRGEPVCPAAGVVEPSPQAGRPSRRCSRCACGARSSALRGRGTGGPRRGGQPTGRLAYGARVKFPRDLGHVIVMLRGRADAAAWSRPGRDSRRSCVPGTPPHPALAVRRFSTNDAK